MVSPMIRPGPLLFWLGLAAAFLPRGAAAQDYVAPKPGVAFQFTLSRSPGGSASERMSITIRAVERDIVSANTTAGRTTYIARLARGVFTFEIA